jgi:hypothetical protein
MGIRSLCCLNAYTHYPKKHTPGIVKLWEPLGKTKRSEGVFCGVVIDRFQRQAGESIRLVRRDRGEGSDGFAIGGGDVGPGK